MSGNNEKQPEAERLNIAGYLLKPTAPKDLLNFVERTLCDSQLRIPSRFSRGQARHA
jgi:hypothetical protein